jgi:hypothetical protein
MSTEILESDYKLDSIYLIESKNSVEGDSSKRGTCFSISDTHIITAFHVIEEKAIHHCYLSSDDYVNEVNIELESVYESRKFDFAILKRKSGIFDTSIALSISNVSIDNVFKSCGFPVEKECYHNPIQVMVTNTLDNVKTREFSFEVTQSDTVTCYDGMSGSPLLYNGKVVGILVVQQGCNTLYAISIKDVCDDPILKDILSINSMINEEGYLNYQPPSHPSSPFKYRISCNKSNPSIKGVDIGFSFGVWNLDDLVENSYDWLIDYSLSNKVKNSFNGSDRSMFKMARSNYPVEDINALSDLFLHIAIRECYRTIPIVNKVFDLNNSKIFSCTHAVLNQDKIELWLGASSVAKNLTDAVFNVVDTINSLLSVTSLKSRLMVLTSEIEQAWPYQDKLKKLSDSSLCLQDRFDKIIVPIFIMHDSALINEFEEDNFIQLFQSEIDKCRSLICNKYSNGIVELLDLRVFYFPVKDIETLHAKFIGELTS